MSNLLLILFFWYLCGLAGSMLFYTALNRWWYISTGERRPFWWMDIPFALWAACSGPIGLLFCLIVLSNTRLER